MILQKLVDAVVETWHYKLGIPAYNPFRAPPAQSIGEQDYIHILVPVNLLLQQIS